MPDDSCRIIAVSSLCVDCSGPLHLNSPMLELKRTYSLYNREALVMLAAEIIAVSSVQSPCCQLEHRHLEHHLKPHLCSIDSL